MGHPEFVRKAVVVCAPGGVALESTSEAVSPRRIAALTRERLTE
jgi:hypothetical protein